MSAFGELMAAIPAVKCSPAECRGLCRFLEEFAFPR